AGLLYLLASIPAPFALIYVPGTLIVSGDATATANHVRASEILFRLGIASELFGFIIFIFVVLALYRLFKAVDKKHALAMATLILISIPIPSCHPAPPMPAMTQIPFGFKMRRRSKNE